MNQNCSVQKLSNTTHYLPKKKLQSAASLNYWSLCKKFKYRKCFFKILNFMNRITLVLYLKKCKGSFNLFPDV